MRDVSFTILFFPCPCTFNEMHMMAASLSHTMMDPDRVGMLQK